MIAPVGRAEPIAPRIKEHPMNRKNLFRQFTTLTLAVGLAAGISGLSTQTASAQGIIVTTPFTFSAGNQQYPAGTYWFTLISEWMLSIRNVDGGGEKFFPVRPEDNRGLGSNGGLAFRNFDGQKTLEAVYIPGTGRATGLTAHETASNKARTHIATATTSTSAETAANGARNATAQ
jgi:hypothetical protein